MKTLQKIAFTLCLTLVFAACGSSGGSTPVDDFFTAKVDGTAWEATTTGTEDKIYWDDSHADFHAIIGNNDDSSRMILTLENYSGTGTYNLPQNGTSSYIENISTGNSWSCHSTTGTTGTVTITSDDGTIISGTYSFTGKNPFNNSTKTISEGEFSATKK